MIPVEFSEFEPHDSCQKNFYRKSKYKAITTGFSFRYKKSGTWKGRLVLAVEVGVSRGGWR